MEAGSAGCLREKENLGFQENLGTVPMDRAGTWPCCQASKLLLQPGHLSGQLCGLPVACSLTSFRQLSLEVNVFVQKSLGGGKKLLKDSSPTNNVTQFGNVKLAYFWAVGAGVRCHCWQNWQYNIMANHKFPDSNFGKWEGHTLFRGCSSLSLHGGL